MNKGEVRYYAATFSLDELKQVYILESEIKNHKFGYKIIKIESFHLGTLVENQIEIFIEGIFKDISINGTLISHIIKYDQENHHYGSPSYSIITFDVFSPRFGKKKICLKYNKISLLEALTIGIAIIGEMNEEGINSMSEYFSFLFTNDTFTLQELVTLLNCVYPLVSKLIVKYPIFYNLITNSMLYRIRSIKEFCDKSNN